MAELIRGILPALITPFDENGRVKTELAAPIVDRYAHEGAAGLYMLGYTGEGAYMDVPARKAWAEAVIREAHGRVKVLVHVGYCANLDDAVDLASNAGKLGADAVSSVGISPQATLNENVSYFKRLSEASGKPFYIYWNSIAGNLNAGKRIDAADLLDAMRAVPTFAGLKFTDSNFYYVERMKLHMPGVNILTGVDQMAVAGGLMGSDGAIGALQAVTCRHMRVMWEKYKAGDIAGAMELQVRANNIYEALDDPRVAIIPAIKAIFEQRYGIPVGCPSAVAPFRRITDESALARLLKVYDENILTTA